jgi:hypothetical protein
MRESPGGDAGGPAFLAPIIGDARGESRRRRPALAGTVGERLTAF